MTKYTFSDLLQGKCFDFSRIEIPIIQRDYVQGQKSPDDEKINKTGLKFIETIFDSMKKNISMNMDFIYGSLKDNKFIPLDGQQRLTTLFLLHWYFACKCFVGTELDEKLEMLSKFSYDTRVSSREFCMELCKLKKKFDVDEKPSDFIRNEHWFFAKFSFDPTVISMLNMLDEIHRLDSEANASYDNLSLLRFNILNMDNFGLTEELYLKMNVRGKLLTSFEKLKAELEKKADNEKWEEKLRKEDEFCFKADHLWTDLFWKNFKTSTDVAFLHFIAELVIIQMTLRIKIKKLEDKEGEESIKTIQGIAENAESLSVAAFDKDIFFEIKRILDLYCTAENDKKRVSMDLWEFCKKDNSLFSVLCNADDKANITYPIRGLFFAQTLYFEKSEYSATSFDDWMRVIRNIAKNATIDSVQTFKGFLNLIEELSAGCGNIYEYLSQNEVKSDFAKTQVQEEIYKAKIIVKKGEAKQLFSELEENPFCTGKLYFAFYCCDVDIADGQSRSSDLNLELFKKVKDVFEKYFSNDDVSDDFRVLLFTCGNNRFYEYWGTRSHKTETYKRCCIESTNDLRVNFSRQEKLSNYNKDILKEAVLKLTSEKPIRDLLSDYKCPSGMPKWEQWIIRHPEEFSKHCSRHYFGITSDNKTCYLYEWRKRPNNRKECFEVPVAD